MTGGSPRAAQTAPRPADAPPSRREVLVLFTAVMLPMFLAAVDQTLLATATPHIARDLGNFGQSTWITVAYLLGATVMAPVYGRLGDRLGRRKVLLAALGVFALGSVTCAAAPSMTALALARGLQGLGGGGLMVMSQALIGELVAPVHRPRYQGYFALVFTASSVGGPLIGGLVVEHADWRWLFLGNLPLCLLAFWRVARLPVHAAPAVRAEPWDLLGLLLFVVTAVSALLWLSLAGHRFAWQSLPSALLLGLASTAGVMLWQQQQRHPAPLLPLALIRLPGVPAICATVVCFAASLFALVFLLPIELQLVRGWSASRAGWQMLPLTCGLVLGATINSRITVRTAMPGRTPPWGMGAAALALVALAFGPADAWSIGLAAGVIGLGFGTVMPAAQLSLQVLAGRDRLGAAAGLISLTRAMGASLGTAAFGGLLFSLLHRVPGGSAASAAGASLQGLDPAQLQSAFRVAYLALAALVATGAFVASRVPPIRLTGWDEALVPAVD